MKRLHLRNFCVYFILCPELNRVKIGYTARNPNQRLEAIASHNAGTTVPLGLITREPGLETRLHARFKMFRIHHEWFAYDEEIARFVKDSAQPWPETWENYLSDEQQVEVEQKSAASGIVLPACNPASGNREVVRLHNSGYDVKTIGKAMGWHSSRVKLIVELIKGDTRTEEQNQAGNR
jgi:hypothetical protein